MTPASFSFGASAIRGTRIVPAMFSFSTSTITTTRDTELTPAVAVPKLDTQQRNVPIGTVREGMVYVEAQEQYRQQRMVENIIAALTAANARITDLEAIVARLAAAEELAEAANDAVTQVQTEVSAVLTATQNTFQAIDPVYAGEFEQQLPPDVEMP